MGGDGYVGVLHHPASPAAIDTAEKNKVNFKSQAQFLEEISARFQNSTPLLLDMTMAICWLSSSVHSLCWAVPSSERHRKIGTEAGLSSASGWSPCLSGLICTGVNKRASDAPGNTHGPDFDL